MSESESTDKYTIFVKMYRKTTIPVPNKRATGSVFSLFLISAAMNVRLFHPSKANNAQTVLIAIAERIFISRFGIIAV